MHTSTQAAFLRIAVLGHVLRPFFHTPWCLTSSLAKAWLAGHLLIRISHKAVFGKSLESRSYRRRDRRLKIYLWFHDLGTNIC